jgi:hypothetical protein
MAYLKKWQWQRRRRGESQQRQRHHQQRHRINSETDWRDGGDRQRNESNGGENQQ